MSDPCNGGDLDVGWYAVGADEAEGLVCYDENCGGRYDQGVLGYEHPSVWGVPCGSVACTQHPRW